MKVESMIDLNFPSTLPSATRNPFYKRGSWTSPKFLLIKSFWKSRNLFSKRFLAVGDKSERRRSC
jgi:hypothetical protein